MRGRQERAIREVAHRIADVKNESIWRQIRVRYVVPIASDLISQLQTCDTEATVSYEREQRRVGGKHLKMVLSPESEPGKIVDAIAFNVPEESWPDTRATRIELVFRLAVNDFRDSLNLQLMVEKILRSQ